MDFAQVPVGFGMALAQNEAAMVRYTHLNQEQKQKVLDQARNAQSDREMWTLVANLANGTMK